MDREIRTGKLGKLVDRFSDFNLITFMAFKPLLTNVASFIFNCFG